MKLFGDPKMERKVRQCLDKLTAATVLAVSGALAFCAGAWLVGAVFRMAFKALGVA